MTTKVAPAEFAVASPSKLGPRRKSERAVKSPSRPPSRGLTRARTIRQVTDAEWAKAQHQAKIELPKEIQIRIKSVFSEFAGQNESIMVNRKILSEILTRVGWDMLPGELDTLIHKYKFNEEAQEFSYGILLGMLYNKINGEISDKELRAAFRAFDQDNNGKIDKTELTEAFKCLDRNQFTTQEIDAMLEEADVDKDGCIDIDEFLNLLTSSKEDLLNPAEADDEIARESPR